MPGPLFQVARRFYVMDMAQKKRSQGRASRPSRDDIRSLLSREDWSTIGHLGLWSAFADEAAVRRLAALSKAERRAFFEHYAHIMEAEPDRSTATPPPTVAADLRLFDLSPTADLAQIHSRYRALALSFHPDRLDGDTGLMQEINEAYQRLQEWAR